MRRTIQWLRRGQKAVRVTSSAPHACSQFQLYAHALLGRRAALYLGDMLPMSHARACAILRKPHWAEAPDAAGAAPRALCVPAPLCIMRILQDEDCCERLQPDRPRRLVSSLMCRALCVVCASPVDRPCPFGGGAGGGGIWLQGLGVPWSLQCGGGGGGHLCMRARERTDYVEGGGSHMLPAAMPCHGDHHPSSPVRQPPTATRLSRVCRAYVQDATPFRVKPANTTSGRRTDATPVVPTGAAVAFDEQFM